MNALPWGRQKGMETGNSSVGGQAGGLYCPVFAEVICFNPLLRGKRQGGIFVGLVPVWSMDRVPTLPELLKRDPVSKQGGEAGEMAALPEDPG